MKTGVAISMNLTITFSPAEEARLRETAQALGTTPENVVRLAITPILDSDTARIVGADNLPGQERSAASGTPRSLLGIWARYGLGPSDEDINQSRADMLANFGCDDPA